MTQPCPNPWHPPRPRAARTPAIGRRAGGLSLALVAISFGCTGAESKKQTAATPDEVHTAEAEPDEAEPAHGEPAHGDHAHGAGSDQPAYLGHRFEKAEDWVAQFEDPDRARWQKPEDVVRLMAVEPGMTVADVGAGTGYFLPHLSAAVGPKGAVWALDIEADMVRYMRERIAREGLANVDPRVVRSDDPQLPASSVDRLLIVNTWHHIPERERYAAKLAASLRPGGALYVVEYTMDSERGPPKSHRIEPEVVVRELEAVKLTTEVRADALPNQYIVIARRR